MRRSPTSRRAVRRGGRRSAWWSALAVSRSRAWPPATARTPVALARAQTSSGLVRPAALSRLPGPSWTYRLPLGLGLRGRRERARRERRRSSTTTDGGDDLDRPELRRAAWWPRCRRLPDHVGLLRHGPTSAGAASCWRRTDGGTTWTAQTSPPPSRPRPAIACPTVVGLRGRRRALTGGERHARHHRRRDAPGRPRPSRPAPVPVGAISCPARRRTAGPSPTRARAVVVVTTDGGTTWTTQTLPGARSTPAGLSCATTTDCFALGDTQRVAVWPPPPTAGARGPARPCPATGRPARHLLSHSLGVLGRRVGRRRLSPPPTAGRPGPPRRSPSSVQVAAVVVCHGIGLRSGGSRRRHRRRHHRRGEHVEPAEPPGRRRLPERRLLPDGVGLFGRGCG